jgi:hypothetical protein
MRLRRRALRKEQGGQAMLDQASHILPGVALLAVERFHERGKMRLRDALRHLAPATGLLAEIRLPDDRHRYCRISTIGSLLGGIRSQTVASLSENRQVAPRPLSRSSLLSSRQLEKPSAAIAGAQPGLIVMR